VVVVLLFVVRAPHGAAPDLDLSHCCLRSLAYNSAPAR
jgi:hypothetical protein